MSFSDLFQRIKHEGHRATAKERDQITRFLGDSDSISKAEAHAAIYVLCLSGGPTSENVTLVERFLSEQTNDYARAGAISCLFTIWKLAEERHVTYLMDALGRILDDERSESSNAAFGAASEMMHARSRYDLSVAVEHALDILFEAAKLELENNEGFAAQKFISASLTLRNAWARSAGKRPIFFNSMGEALEVYRDKSAYLLRPVH